MIEQDNSIITRAIRSIEVSHDIDAQMVMIAIGALEKQNAKIIPIRNGDEFATCPNCGHDLMYHREGFCERCGQKYVMLNEGERKMTNRELREPTEAERKQDIKFLTHIIFEIRDYARSAGLEVDETLKTTAEWILALLQVASFNGGEGE